jgi:hypothetical protein
MHKPLLTCILASILPHPLAFFVVSTAADYVYSLRLQVVRRCSSRWIWTTQSMYVLTLSVPTTSRPHHHIHPPSNTNPGGQALQQQVDLDKVEAAATLLQSLRKQPRLGVLLG